MRMKLSWVELVGCNNLWRWDESEDDESDDDESEVDTKDDYDDYNLAGQVELRNDGNWFQVNWKGPQHLEK